VSAQRSSTSWGDAVTAISDAPEPSLWFAVDVRGPVLRVSLWGELDLASADVFDSLFDLETGGIERVVLDLGALTFCDVSGVNALTGLQSFHRCHGRAATFTAVLPQVERLMALLDAHSRPLSGGALPG
jgi:anti-anti-sigma factor